MAQNVYQRRVDDKVLTSSNPADVWEDWKGDKESWLFLAPHDDDIILGGGLTFLASLSEGIPTYAAITTNGESGYCYPEHKGKVAQIREAEARASFAAMGLPEDHLFFLGYHDSGLDQFTGHFWTDDEQAPTTIAGATGLENSYTWLLRKVRPTRVFFPSCTDIHPDHKIVGEELMISIFHASGTIWPELGEPIESVPILYEYATYCDFLTPPNMRITVTPDLLEKKLAGIAAYKSQDQIGELVELQRQAGCRECVRQIYFKLITPGKYNYLFD